MSAESELLSAKLKEAERQLLDQGCDGQLATLHRKFPPSWRLLVAELELLSRLGATAQELGWAIRMTNDDYRIQGGS